MDIYVLDSMGSNRTFMELKYAYSPAVSLATAF